METPSSMRRVTRSQTSAASQKSKQDEAVSRRAALLDITNDSPIVGLQAEKTPASTAAKSRPRPKQTPGSGEALLRGQVKTLLQKVEEEGGAVTKPAVPHLPRFRGLIGLSRSPEQLLAPTPANTPQVGSMCSEKDGFVVDDMTMPCVTMEEEELLIPKQVVSALKQEKEALGECQLNRALLFDSPGKSDDSSDDSLVSSSLTFEENGSSYVEKSADDDSSSAWSIQVNASSEKGDCDDEELLEDMEEEEEEEGDECGYDEEEEDGGGCFDDLCEGMNKMSVMDGEEKANLPEFRGKHTRFIYNSDDEIVGEEEEEVGVGCAEKATAEEGVLVLRGLPKPEGKHLRFHEEEEEEEEEEEGVLVMKGMW